MFIKKQENKMAASREDLFKLYDEETSGGTLAFSFYIGHQSF